jgi:hypothetical protein
VWRAAAKEGNAQAVVAWLDEGGGVDARCAERCGFTLLMAAAVGGHEAMVRMLLQRGASVNLQASNGVSTALIYAAMNGDTTIVQALLDAKADASLQTTNGGTALMYAEDQKHTATAQLLRQHAKRQAAEVEARAAASAAHAAATADAMAAELLGEEAAEKEEAAKKGKGKKKKAKAPPSTDAAEPAANTSLAGASRPAAASVASKTPVLEPAPLAEQAIAAAPTQSARELGAVAALQQAIGAGPPKPAAAQEKLPDEPSS